MVTVSMEDDIRFVQDLGKREKLSRDVTILDPELGNPWWYSYWQECYGRKIAGPAENWWDQDSLTLAPTTPSTAKE